jgi:hypothetical protein
LSPVYGDLDEPDRLNQGDIFARVPFVGFDARSPARFLTSLGIVTAHNCECDKFFSERDRGFSEDVEATWPIIVAPVYPLSSLAVYGHGDVGALEEIDRAFRTNVAPLRAVNSATTGTQEGPQSAS